LKPIARKYSDREEVLKLFFTGRYDVASLIGYVLMGLIILIAIAFVS